MSIYKKKTTFNQGCDTLVKTTAILCRRLPVASGQC